MSSPGRLRSGDVVHLAPFGDAIAASRTQALLKATQLEVVRLVLHAGRELPMHAAPGEITLLGLEGEVELQLEDGTRRLAAGDFIHLGAGAPHALRALRDASLLLTIALAGPA